MAFEEEIKFETRESAVDFQKFLRKNNCSSHITVSHEYSVEGSCEGKIVNFIDLITSIENSKENNTSIDENLFAFKKVLVEEIELLTKFFDEHKVGDVIKNSSSYELISKSLNFYKKKNGEPEWEKDEEDDEEEWDEEDDDEWEDEEEWDEEEWDEEEMKRISQRMREIDEIIKNDTESEEDFRKRAQTLTILKMNNLTSEKDGCDDRTLTRTMPVDELKIIFTSELAELFLNFKPKELEEKGIIFHYKTYINEYYVVHVSSNILLVDLSEIEDFLQTADLAEGEYNNFCSSSFFRLTFINQLMGLIENGCSSEKELRKALNSQEFNVGEMKDLFSFDIDDTYLSSIIEELKKMGILTGKDGKLKKT